MTVSASSPVVVITGGNRGIGRALARAFARDGAAVAIGARDAASLEEVAAEVREIGADCLATRCDVADPASVEAFGTEVIGWSGRVDSVVACAGIGGPTKPLHEITPEEWRECLGIDLDGVYLTFRRFVPEMIERRAGNLIAISSMTGKRPLYGRTPYAAAKMGVIGLVRTLALELGEHGIRVNSVCPGAVEGERIEAVINRQADIQRIPVDEARRQLTDSAPLGRLVRADEVAAACVYLASPAASAITGEDMNVSAGLVTY